MKTVLYYFIFFFWFIASLLPLRFLYIFSDLLYFSTLLLCSLSKEDLFGKI